MERKCDRFDIQTAACLLRMMPVPEEVIPASYSQNYVLWCVLRTHTPRQKGVNL